MRILLPLLFCTITLSLLIQCNTTKGAKSSDNNDENPNIQITSSLGSKQNSNLSKEAFIARSVQEKLKRWQTIQSKNRKTPLQIVYWTPKGVPPREGFKTRISAMVLAAQDYYRREMQKFSLEDVTFDLNLIASDKCQIYLVESENLSKSPTSNEEHRQLYAECIDKLKSQGVDLYEYPTLTVLNTASWDEPSLTLSHSFYTRFFPTNRFYSSHTFIVDSPYSGFNENNEAPASFTFKDSLHNTEIERINNSLYAEKFFHNTLYQIGHSLGLPHVAYSDQKDETIPVMSCHHFSQKRWQITNKEEKYTRPRLSLQSALMLLSHPSFSGSSKALNHVIKSEFETLDFENTKDNRLSFKGKIKSSIPAYLFVAKIWNAEENELHAKPLISEVKQGEFGLTFPSLKPNTLYRIKWSFNYLNGWSEWRQTEGATYMSTVETDGLGRVNTKQLKEFTALSALGLKVGSDDYSGVLHELTKMRKAKFGKEVLSVGETLAHSLLTPKPSFTPNQVPQEIKDISLSQLKEQSFTVGWDTVIKDRFPKKNALIEKRGKVYKYSIYAHAPSIGVYELNKKWKQFSGVVSVVNGYRGKIIFIVKGDGKVLWKSKVINQQEIEKFNITVSNVDKLEIMAEAYQGNKTSCWSIWLDPVISR